MPSSRPDLQHRSPSPPPLFPHPTARQLEVLAWVQQGKSAGDIGTILGISGRTVESHLQRLYEHLEVRTAIQAVLKARALGLLSDEAP